MAEKRVINYFLPDPPEITREKGLVCYTNVTDTEEIRRWQTRADFREAHRRAAIILAEMDAEEASSRPPLLIVGKAL